MTKDELRNEKWLTEVDEKEKQKLSILKAASCSLQLIR